MKLFALATVCIIGLASALPAAAQEPTPVSSLVDFDLVRSIGGFELTVSGAATAVGESFDIEATVAPDGEDGGAIVPLGSGDSDSVAIMLPEPIIPARAAACYRVRFFVRASADEGKAYATGGGLATRACTDASGRTSYPAYDGVDIPAPAAPAGVRFLQYDTEWSVAWDPAPHGAVIGYVAAVHLLDAPWDAGGVPLRTIPLGQVPPDRSRALGSFSFFTLGPARPAAGCGYAFAFVFAIGPDAPSPLPRAASQKYCFDGVDLSFPDSGRGAARSESATPAAAWVLGATGLAAIASGALMRRRTAGQ